MLSERKLKLVNLFILVIVVQLLLPNISTYIIEKDIMVGNPKPKQIFIYNDINNEIINLRNYGVNGDKNQIIKRKIELRINNIIETLNSTNATLFNVFSLILALYGIFYIYDITTINSASDDLEKQINNYLKLDKVKKITNDKIINSVTAITNSEEKSKNSIKRFEVLLKLYYLFALVNIVYPLLFYLILFPELNYLKVLIFDL